MILPCQAACIIKTTMAPLICMLETWFAYQEIHNDSGNILIYEPGMLHAYYGMYDHFHGACCRQLGHIQRFCLVRQHASWKQLWLT